MTKRYRWGLFVACFITAVVFVYREDKKFSAALDRKPNREAFIGRWRLESDSFPSVFSRTGKSPFISEIFLGQDGRFKASDMPMENHFKEPLFSLVSTEGEWELERQQAWVLSLVVNRGGYPLRIESKNGEVVALSYAVSDPDSSEHWIWKKVP